MNILQTLLDIFKGPPTLNDEHALASTQIRPEPTVADARTRTSIEELTLDMGYYDGFVREAALKRAAELASPLLVPAIAERLNDWVPQVRVLAQQVLLGMLPALDTADAMHLLPVVQDLRRAGRADHSAWITRFEKAVVDKVGLQAIVGGVLDPDMRIARACYQVIEAEGLAPSANLIARLLPASRDIVLARRAVEAIFRLPEPVRAPLFQRALDSSFGMVRAIALRPLLSEQTPESDALAMRMASDSHTWVRLIASGYLARRGIDTAEILEQALRAEGVTGRRIRACLAGFVELRATQRLDLVRSFTSHPLARVQVSAYLAWLRLEPSRRDDIAREVLASPHRRVRKLVLQLVRDDGASLDTEAGLSLMAVHDDLDLMFAFAKAQPWGWLELIVRLEPRSRLDPELRAHLKQELFAWFDSAVRYAKPSAAQRALFRETETVKRLATLCSGDEHVIAQRLKFELGET